MRFNTLDEWLNWQEQLHPSEIDLGLERISHVYQRLVSNPPQHRVITVAGTNGKGSSVAMLEAIYRAAGYRVGSYTSPHLIRYTERIKINGEEVNPQRLCEAFERVDQARGDISLSYFEFGTLAAFDIFNQSNLDLIVLEVGLGGRLDAVNIINPDVALITNVALDHQAWLGNDRESIAREKAGIMRANTPVIYGEANLPQAVSELAQQLGAQLYCYRQEFDYQTSDSGWRWWSGDHTREALPLPALRGDYQLQNAAGVLRVVECLNDRLAVGQAEIRQGLLSAQVAGRFQIIPGAVTTILDVGHNPHAAEVLKKNLLAMASPGKTLAVFGMMADKDIEQLVTIMTPVIDQWLVGGLDIPRAAKPGAIAQTLKQAGVDDGRVQQFDHVAQAYQQARQSAGPADRVVVFGSFYTVAAVMAQLAQREDEGAEGRVWNIIASNNG